MTTVLTPPPDTPAPPGAPAPPGTVVPTSAETAPVAAAPVAPVALATPGAPAGEAGLSGADGRDGADGWDDANGRHAGDDRHAGHGRPRRPTRTTDTPDTGDTGDGHAGEVRAGPGWLPVPVCDERCVPAATGEPTVGTVRAWGRLAAAGLVVLTGVPVALVFGRLRPAARVAVLRWWTRAVLVAFGVRLHVTGGSTCPDGALLVSNHVSWLDVVAIDAVRPGRMVAKDEVRGWPVVGRLATAAGTVYLDRERLSALPAAVAEVAAALRAGDSVTMFPEGTTWCGRRGGRFRAAAFQAAIDAGAPVVPVALRFVLAGGGGTTTPAFVGPHTTLWTVLRRTAHLRGLTVEVHLLPALDPPPPARGPAQPARRALARAAEHAVTTRARVP